MAPADLVSSLSSSRSALCIVDTRARARALYMALASDGEEGVYHLSAMMTRLHRSAWEHEIAGRLARGERCVVVATPVAETGLDARFDVVWRELSGVDRLVLSADRVAPGGEMRVFELAEGDSGPSYPAYLSRDAGIARQLLAGGPQAAPGSLLAPFLARRRAAADLGDVDVPGRKSPWSLMTRVKGYGDLAFDQLARDLELYGTRYAALVPWDPDAIGAGEPDGVWDTTVNLAGWELAGWIGSGLAGRHGGLTVLHDSEGGAVYSDETGLVPAPR